MEFELFDFVLASTLMGIGIGTDVALATLARAKYLNTPKVIALWVIGVSLTHTLFPMLGYLTTYIGVQYVPMLTPFIGLVAFVCIFWFLKSELQSLFTNELEEESDTQHLLITLGLILAVSWDALWSGPAKSAQVIGWPELLVWLSFLLVGLAVSLLALSSMYFAKFLIHVVADKGPVKMTLLWLQYSVISYFAWLALLRYSFDINVSWSIVLLFSAVVMGLIMHALHFFNIRKRECA